MTALDDALNALYAEVPGAGCKGLCVDSCGPIVATAGEAGRMFKASGKRLDVGDDLRCGYLDRAGKCSVYDVRPLICRLYGSVDHRLLRCPYGCAPETLLTNREAQRLLWRSRDVGGPPVRAMEAEVEDVLLFMENSGLREAGL